MRSRGFKTDEFIAQQAEREETAEIQAFIEANPEYWMLTHGHAPLADDAARSFDWRPPAEMGYSEHLSLLVRHSSTREILAQVDVAADLLATGVYHLGFFMTATRTHGSGFAHRLYEAYERWALDHGARWLRLGVVEVNRRAEAFWRRLGYLEVKRKADYVLGDRSHVLITMVKPVRGETLVGYLDAVPHDRNASG
jgi:GNAT superfamily N-acetyltransferase